MGDTLERRIVLIKRGHDYPSGMMVRIGRYPKLGEEIFHKAGLNGFYSYDLWIQPSAFKKHTALKCTLP